MNDEPLTYEKMVKAIEKAHKRAEESLALLLMERGVLPKQDPSKVVWNAEKQCFEASEAHMKMVRRMER